MVCNSIPGHPLGFSPIHNRNAKLWNVGWKPVFRCQRSRFHKREFWNSQSTVNNTRVPEVLESFGFRRSREDQHLHIRRTSHVAKHPGKNAFFFFFKMLPRSRETLNITVTPKSRIQANQTPPIGQHLQGLWKSVIKCPVTDQMAVALVFRGASSCSVRLES